MTKDEIVGSFLGVQPSFTIAFVGRNDKELLESINKKMELSDGKMRLFVYEDEVAPLPTMDVTRIADYSKMFRTIAREYEVLILNDICQRIEDRDRLFKTAFKALRNAGELIVIEDEIDNLREILSSVGFVAINEIESEVVTLLSAKKMHGWGHGL